MVGKVRRFRSRYRRPDTGSGGGQPQGGRLPLPAVRRGRSCFIPAMLGACSQPLECEALSLHTGVARAPGGIRPLLHTPCPCAVPIIRLLGTTLLHLRLDTRTKWYHIMEKRPCYRNHF